MTRRERLLRTLRGEPVDRPAVNFYEIGGFAVDPADGDPFNIYNDPSWRPLLELAENETDLIRMRSPQFAPVGANPLDEFLKEETFIRNGSRFTRTTITIAGRTLTSLSRRDCDLDTVWQVEHLLKNVDDLEAYLQLPGDVQYSCHVSGLVEEEKTLGDRGIVMVDTPDPICIAAALFSMADYTIVALTEGRLFHRLLEKIACGLWRRTEQIAGTFPGRLWRIFGPEYATPPYLPPRLFQEYVVRYTGPMIEIIRRHGGFARVHCHGRIREALPMILKMGADATDPIEPPPQGDIELAEVRRLYGKDLVLFGNLEVADIENMRPCDFERVVADSLRGGTEGQGRGFVLMPSSCPYGRTISSTTLANYRTMVRLAKGFAG